MKVSQFIILSALVGSPAAAQARTRRRHLNTIKGDESSMSYASTLYAAKGSSSKKSDPTLAPTPAPPKPGECGSVIDTGNNGNGNVFTLQKDLKCPCDDAADISALTVDGRGTVLNLNGHTVECETFTGFSTPVAIKVVGTANTIKGPGTVKVKANSGFANGITLSEGGFHTVKGVSIGPDLFTGIEIKSSDNIISNNIITQVLDNGILLFNDVGVSVDNNQILDNAIIASGDAGDSGIYIVGKRNVIQGNTIDRSGNGVFVVSFAPPSGSDVDSEGNIIKHNSITNSGGGGIVIGSGAKTLIIDNAFAGNGANNDNIVNFGADTTIVERCEI